MNPNNPQPQNPDVEPSPIDDQLSGAFGRLHDDVATTTDTEAALHRVHTGSTGSAHTLAPATARDGRSPFRYAPVAIAASLIAIMAVAAGLLFATGGDDEADPDTVTSPAELEESDGVDEFDEFDEFDDTDNDTSDDSGDGEDPTDDLNPEDGGDSEIGETPPTGDDDNNLDGNDSPDLDPAPDGNNGEIEGQQPPTTQSGYYPWIYPTSNAEDLLATTPTDTRLADVVETATGFVVDYLGYREPELEAVVMDGTDEATIDFRARGDGGALAAQTSTIHLQRYAVDDAEFWAVMEVTSDDPVIISPTPGATITSDLQLSGEGSGFEGTVVAYFVPDGIDSTSTLGFPADDAIQTEPMITGNTVTPFVRDFSLSDPGTPGITVLLRGDWPVDNGEAPVALRKFEFVATTDTDPDEGDPGEYFPWIFPTGGYADFATPELTATAFVTDFLGFAPPEFDATATADSGRATIAFHARGESGVVLDTTSIISLERFSADGDDFWGVVEVQAADTRITRPAAGSTIGSTIQLSGNSGGGFEANNPVTFIPDGVKWASEPANGRDPRLQQEPSTTGWTPARFTRTFDVIDPGTPGITVLVQGETAVNGSETPVALRKFVYDPDNAKAPLDLAATVKIAAVIGVDADDTLSVRSGAGVDNARIGDLAPDSRAVVLTGAQGAVGETTWYELEFGSGTGWVSGDFLTNAVDLPRGAAESVAVVFEALQSNDPGALGTLNAGGDIAIGLYPQAPLAPVITAFELNNPDELAAVRVWGEEDGTGDPVNATIDERLSQIARSTAVQAPTSVRRGPDFLGSGNISNTLASDYPDALIVEYHNPGTDEFGGLDWASLAVVLRARGDTWSLVGLFEHGWTI